LTVKVQYHITLSLRLAARGRSDGRLFAKLITLCVRDSFRPLVRAQLWQDTVPRASRLCDEKALTN